MRKIIIALIVTLSLAGCDYNDCKYEYDPVLEIELFYQCSSLIPQGSSKDWRASMLLCERVASSQSTDYICTRDKE